jgi:PKD repeat protein
MKKFLLLLFISFGVLQLNAFTVTITSTQVLCYGGCNGTATAVPSGGVAPYMYSWSNAATTQVATGLCAGSYTVTVTDATTATATATVYIYQPVSPLTLNFSTTPIVCNGGTGTITAIPGGGTAPYTFYWSNGPTTTSITNVSVGTYTCTVTDVNNCNLANAITLNQPAPITVALNPSSSAVCETFPVSFNASVTGGTPPFTYNWAFPGGSPSSATTQNPTTTYSTAGNYSPTLTVTDANGCTQTNSTSITVLLPPTVSITPSNSIICSGSSVTFNASGAVTYTWAPGNIAGASVTLSPTTTTTYTLTGMNANGCMGTATVTITVNPNPGINITSSTNVSCFGGSDGVINSAGSGGTPPYAYLWSWNNVTATTISGVPAGTYNVGIVDANGCTSSNAATITEPSAIVITSGTVIPAGCNMSDGSATVMVNGGTPGYTYLWAPTTSTMFAVTNAPAGVETVTVTDVNGCVATLAVTITDSCDYVWPGDANDDAVADNLDILDIGIANGATGTTRLNASLNWIGQPSTDWGQTLLSGTDYKFVDCNGDGSVNPNDTNAVVQNFGFTHNNREGGAPVYNATLPDLTVTMGQNILASNTAGTMTIGFGSSAVPVSNFYGLAFTLNFDPAQIDAATFSMNENGSWLGTAGNDLMGVVLNNGTGTGSVQVALTRLDHQNTNGFGDIAHLGFMTTGNLVGSGNMQNVNFTISNVTVIDANEMPQTVNTVNDSVIVMDPLMTGITPEQNVQQLSAYPNPFTESVQINLPAAAKDKTCEVVLTDAAGRVVLSRNVTGARSITVDRGMLESGIYFCSIRSEGQLTGTIKLIVD